VSAARKGACPRELFHAHYKNSTIQRLPRFARGRILSRPSPRKRKRDMKTLLAAALLLPALSLPAIAEPAKKKPKALKPASVVIPSSSRGASAPAPTPASTPAARPIPVVAAPLAPPLHREDLTLEEMQRFHQ
jgi:hypothetical protein